jgi:hypothetical protein
MKTYTKGELRALTPDDVVRWVNVKAFDLPDPPSDANPTFVRTRLLAYWNKSISFFMPDRLVVWVLGRNEGNPTRSIEVDSLIKRIKKKEVRKQGELSKAKRPLTEDKFEECKILYRITKAILFGGMVCIHSQIFNFICSLALMTRHTYWRKTFASLILFAMHLRGD